MIEREGICFDRLLMPFRGRRKAQGKWKRLATRRIIHPDYHVVSQVMNCIACLEDLGSMEWAANIYVIAQHPVAKP